MGARQRRRLELAVVVLSWFGQGRISGEKRRMSVMIGALLFGIVIGWVTYRTLRKQGETVALSNIASVIGAVGGGWVTTQLNTPELFGWYCIGLFLGFFAYLILGATVFKDVGWLGDGADLFA